MTTKINCTECQRYCGEIRDAKLLKGLKFICPSCESKRIKQKAERFLKKDKGYSSTLNDLFGGFKL